MGERSDPKPCSAVGFYLHFRIRCSIIIGTSTFVIQKVNKLLMLIKGKVPLNLKHVVDSLESVSSSILLIC